MSVPMGAGAISRQSASAVNAMGAGPGSATGHHDAGGGSVPLGGCCIGEANGVHGDWAPVTKGDTGGSAAIISVMTTTSSESGSMVAPTVSAVAVAIASATAAISVPPGTPSELVSDSFAWRRLFTDLLPLIVRCTIAATSAGVNAMPLAIGKTRLKTGGGETVIGICGTSAGAAAPLDDAPGVLDACTVPRPRDRPREEDR